MTAVATANPAIRRDTAIRSIVTPEGVNLPLKLAGRGARLGALALDIFFIGLVIVGSIVVLIYLGLNLAHLGGPKAQKGGFISALQFLVILFFIGGFLLHNGWFLFFELGPRGATPGKRLLGIRVAARDGGTLTPEMVIARNLLRDIELFMPLGFLVQQMASGGSGAGGLAATAWFALFALFPCFNRDRLRAGDLIAGTWVVETQKQRLLPVMSLVSASAATEPDDRQAYHATPHVYRFGEAELAIYGEHELQTLERVLRDNRPETLAAVAEAICVKIGWTAPGPGEIQPFLQAFYTQLRARLESGMRFGKRKANKFTV